MGNPLLHDTKPALRLFSILDTKNLNEQKKVPKLILAEFFESGLTLYVRAYICEYEN